jgi:glycosyltransferase involved in cell wall biosynthesis
MKSGLRILHVIPSLDPRTGGPVEGLKQISTSLVGKGHYPAVICLDVADAPWLRHWTIPVEAVGRGIGKYGFRYRLIDRIARQAKQYDAVVLHGLWQFTGLATWLALRGTSTPYVVYPHGMLDPWFNRQYPAKHAKKLIYWFLAQRNILRSARAVMFTCEEERQLARRAFPLYACNDVAVGYGISKPSGDPAAQIEAFWGAFPKLRGKRFLINIGRIHPKKGHDLLIQAFADMKGSELMLAIAGPDDIGWKSSLEDLARQRGATDRIVWTGMLERDVKWGSIRAAEAMILPSHQENFGVAVAEALACGVPVLLSDKVNIWREVVEADAGLVADDTVAGTSNLLLRWAQKTPEARALMRAYATACFQKHFDINAVIEEFLSVLERVGVGVVV